MNSCNFIVAHDGRVWTDDEIRVYIRSNAKSEHMWARGAHSSGKIVGAGSIYGWNGFVKDANGWIYTFNNIYYSLIHRWCHCLCLIERDQAERQSFAEWCVWCASNVCNACAALNNPWWLMVCILEVCLDNGGIIACLVVNRVVISSSALMTTYF